MIYNLVEPIWDIQKTVSLFMLEVKKMNNVMARAEESVREKIIFCL